MAAQDDIYAKLLKDVNDPTKAGELITLAKLWDYFNTIKDITSGPPVGTMDIVEMLLTVDPSGGGSASVSILNNTTTYTFTAAYAGVGLYSINADSALSYTNVIPQTEYVLYPSFNNVWIKYTGADFFIGTSGGDITDPLYVSIKLFS